MSHAAITDLCRTGSKAVNVLLQEVETWVEDSPTPEFLGFRTAPILAAWFDGSLLQEFHHTSPRAVSLPRPPVNPTLQGRIRIPHPNFRNGRWLKPPRQYSPTDTIVGRFIAIESEEQVMPLL